MVESGYDVAVVGATGAVGKQMVNLLAERHFPIRTLHVLASENSLGKTVHFNGEEIAVEVLESFDFSKVRIALFSIGSQVSAHYAPKAAAQGCVVIDNSAAFRQHEEVPLIIPEVNPDALSYFSKKNIIANPNCAAIQMLVAINPLHQFAGISRIVVATYQSVSGAGTEAIEELEKQTINRLSGKEVTVAALPAPIAFNVIPHIDVFEDNGYTGEEMKIIHETHKILGDDSIQVAPTAVRVPVFYGHSEAVNLEMMEPLSAERAQEILQDAPGVCLMNELNHYPMPSEHAAGQDAVFVGRIRDDLFSENKISLWVVSDNLRKGAALNAVQIAEMLVDQRLV